MDKKGKVIPLDPALRKRKIKSTVKPRKRNMRSLRRKTESIQEYKRGTAINRSTFVVAGIFFLAVLTFLVQTLYVFFTTPDIPVNMIRMGSIDTPMVIQGIIIRDETVYTAPSGGVLQFSVSHYNRVRPGSEVASIQNIDEVANIRLSIENVEDQIIQLQDIRGDLSAVDPAVQMINGQIQNMVDQRLSRHIHLDMSEVYSLRDSITQNVNLRNQMIVTENLQANVRQELGIQHNVLMGELNANRAPIRIGGGGIVAPIADGLEELLTFESMYNLSRDQVTQEIDLIIPRQEVDYGDSVFKIINSNRWYIAAHIPNELADGLNVGDTPTLYIEGRQQPLTVSVHYVSPDFADTFVIFRSTAYMIDFLDTRSIFFRTTDTMQYGLRIANTAITEHRYLAIPLSCIYGYDIDTDAYVVRIIGNEDFRIPVAIEDNDGYFAFVQEDPEFLPMGSFLRERDDPTSTRIITGERFVPGVFRVNVGIAEFVPVNLPEDTPIGSVYTILDPTLNTRLRIYDHIVTNAALVEIGDIVFSGVR